MTALGDNAHRSGGRPLRLLAQGLAERDLAKLEVFLRLARDNLRFEWQVVHEGAADVRVLADERRDPSWTTPATSVAILAIDGSLDKTFETRRRFLVRPFQYENLVDSLSTVEQLIAAPLDRAATAPAKAPAEVPAEVPVDESDVPPPVIAASAPGGDAPLTVAVVAAAAHPTPPPAIVAALPASKTTLPAVVSRPALPFPPDSVFRLRRWPSADLLTEYRYHVRLASCLSPRHIGLAELARLTNVEMAQCAAFLSELLAAGLLDVKAPAPQSKPSSHRWVASLPAPPKAEPPAPPPPVESLFEKLRRRFLGLHR